MAISTKAELQTAVGNWIKRADLTDRIPEFITLAESRINRLLRERLAEADQPLTGVVGSRFVPLPTAYNEARGLWIVDAGGRCPIDYADPLNLPVSATAGKPRYWTIDGANLALERPCDQAYGLVLRMVSKFVLSDDAPTNSLLTEHPDIYLFGTLCEAAPFLRDADLQTAYEGRFDRAIDEVNDNDGRLAGLQMLQTEVSMMHTRRYGFDIRRGD